MLGLERGIVELCDHDKAWAQNEARTIEKLKAIFGNVATDIQHVLRKAQVWSFLGKIVTITIDRQLGSVHPKHNDIIYPINYGYINGVIAPDGEALDVYVIGEERPLEEFTGRVIAIVHRENDIEDKLVAVPDGITLSATEIKNAVSFQEKYYDSWIEIFDPKIIHITGASGSGTTTLGKAISEKYGFKHLDTDDFFWLPTDPKYTTRREPSERQRLLSEAISKAERCVISGSLCGWGDIFIPRFELVILVETPTEVRIERLKQREYINFGERILPGGDMYQHSEDDKPVI